MSKLHRMANAVGGHAVVYLALVVASTGAIAFTAMGLFRQSLASVDALLSANQSPTHLLGETITRQGKVSLSQDDWNERIRTKEYWNGRGSGGSAPFVVRSNLQGPPPSPAFDRASLSRSDAARFHDGDETTFRTVCVRLCDGYFFPISFSTTESNFSRDRQTCESSCGSPAKLYVYKNPGEEPTDMRDLDGKPYSRLKTANLYRTKFEPQCKCKADPWDQEAMDRHRLYALEAASLKGDKVAAKEASALKAQMAATADTRRTEGGRKIGVLNTFSATIVAANPAGEADETTTTDAKPAPPPEKQATNKDKPRSSNANSRPPEIMRLGGSGSSGNVPRPATGNTSRSSERWRSTVFQGN